MRFSLKASFSCKLNGKNLTALINFYAMKVNTYIHIWIEFKL